MSVPALKESIDIEKRNYKISNVNLSLSNYEHNGVRFSETVGNSSLINQSVDIYWISPSVTQLGDGTGDTDAKKIFHGWVLRYDMDSDKIKLVVEDRSQKTLHKDLPLEISNLSGEASIPNEYKNKPIPMVYGHVKTSPCVRYIEGAEWIVRADSRRVASINEIFVYKNNNSYKIPRSAISSEGTVEQFVNHYRQGYIRLLDIPLPEEESSEPIASIFTWAAFTPHGIGLFFHTEPYYDYNQTADNQFNYIPDVNIFYDNDMATGYTWDITTSDDSPSQEGSSEPQHWVFRIPFTPPDSELYGIYRTILKMNDYVLDTFSTPYYETDVSDYQDEDPNSLLPDFLAFGTDNDQNVLDTGDAFMIFNTATYPDVIGNAPRKRFRIFLRKEHLLICAYRQHEYFPANYIENSTIELNEISVETLTKVPDIFNNTQFFADVWGREYEHSEPGWSWFGGTTQTNKLPDRQIKHLLIEELGVPEENITQHEWGEDKWETSFSIYKKTNSKQIIENLASVTPFLPRFDYLGIWKFDTIKDIYNSDDFTASYTIREKDCISWSYSRTKIEDVKTLVTYKYEYDHQVEEPISEITYKIKEILPPENVYKYEYYGFVNNDGTDNDDDSTLIIDDVRSQYISNEDTAKKFAKWYLRWHCNQHLKIKVKLPLNYLDIEVGSLISFDKVLGDVLPYGIRYAKNTTTGIYLDENNVPDKTIYGDILNGQQVFPLFLCLKTSKSLTGVDVEMIQLHNLTNAYAGTGDVYGITDQDAWNYDTENPATIPYGVPVYASDFEQNGCPIFLDEIYGYSNNFVGGGEENIETSYAGGVFVAERLADVGVGSDAYNYWVENGYPSPGDLNAPSIYLESNCYWATIHVLNKVDFIQTGYQTTWTVDIGEDDAYTVNIAITQDLLYTYGNGGVRSYFDEDANNLPAFVGQVNLEIGCDDFTNPLITIENYDMTTTGGDIWQGNPSWITLDIKAGTFPSNDLAEYDEGYTRDIVINFRLYHNSSDSGYQEINKTITYHFYKDATVNDTGTDVVLGDMNGDEEWDVLDIVILGNCVLNDNCGDQAPPTVPEDNTTSFADVNQDGLFNVLDIVQLANCVLNDTCEGLYG